ncbi:hypothetical protein GCM10027343_28910 [Noviherbaspirillum agri]
MSIAAVGLIRSVDTGTLVVGNLAFKQTTTSAADAATEAAIKYLEANQAGAHLFSDDESDGYYATRLDDLDITGKSSNIERTLVDWNDDDCAYASDTTWKACKKPTAKDQKTEGYATQVLITRMCEEAKAPAATNCARPIAGSSGTSPKRGEVKYGEGRLTSTAGPFYRIIVRAEGPRNTVSYTETYIHF